MKKIGLFYGTDTGNSERIAEMIKDGIEEKYQAEVTLHDLTEVNKQTFAPYTLLILSHPTWYYGELQSHWEDFWEDFKSIDFSGKKVACMGLGDQYDYADYFLDAMGLTHDIVVNNGGTPCGYTSTEGFEHTASKASIEDDSLFVGLALDEDQQPELTESRINDWIEQIAEEFEIL
jgi:flavodoxin I